MRFSLRIKLALISLFLLLIPVAGLYFSEIIQQDLLESRRQTIQFSARAVASALSGRTDIFADEGFHSLNAQRDLYLYQLTNPIRLNGKEDDWQPQIKDAVEFGASHLLFSSSPYNYNSLHYKQLTGMRGNYLYAIFLVTDNHIIYRDPKSPHLDQSDHLLLSIEDLQGQLHRYAIAPAKPGWVNGYQISKEEHPLKKSELDSRIQGMWVESEQGYIVELRIPEQLVGRRLAFAIGDVDDNFIREVTALIGTDVSNDEGKIGWLLPPSSKIEEVLQNFARPNSRIIIVDNNQHVRASYGHLSQKDIGPNKNPSVLTKISSQFHRLLSPLYQFFTTPFITDFTEQKVQPTTFDLTGVSEVLQKGISTTTRYTLQDNLIEVMAAISPLSQGNQILGAVIVEQTTNSILALQNRVIEESLTLTIIVFVFGGLVLVIYASRLSWRIRSLGKQAAAAINDNGQIQTTIQPSTINDEIGDLSKTLTEMLGQLQVQIAYREKMADNLEHEMRTPLAGISASLKNLSKELNSPEEDISKYLQWALTDVDRLENLLTSIRDATSLQDALSKDQKEEFELDTAIELWLTHNWRPAFDDVSFIFHKPESTVIFRGDPGRIQQMLDKLIENAVSFHTPTTPIEITLSKKGDETNLKVANKGPLVPKEMHNQIFNSMVSHRTKKRSGPHLGLGLYIVRTIVEQYRGKVRIESYPDGSGVIFTLTLKSATS